VKAAKIKNVCTKKQTKTSKKQAQKRVKKQTSGKIPAAVEKAPGFFLVIYSFFPLLSVLL
jgi:hypothetical protein